VFHHRDDTTIGHIVGCFLALRLEVDLQRRLDERSIDVAWPDLIRNLSELRAVEVTVDEQRYRFAPSCAVTPRLRLRRPASDRRVSASTWHERSA
jgi:hypothetical protein